MPLGKQVKFEMDEGIIKRCRPNLGKMKMIEGRAREMVGGYVRNGGFDMELLVVSGRLKVEAESSKLKDYGEVERYKMHEPQIHRLFSSEYSESFKGHESCWALIEVIKQGNHFIVITVKGNLFRVE
jgi:hypothetical protein